VYENASIASGRGFIVVEKCKLVHWFLYLCWISSLIGIIKFGGDSQVTTERVFVDHDWHQLKGIVPI
jgi:hypothetical protein